MDSLNREDGWSYLIVTIDLIFLLLCIAIALSGGL